MAAPDWTPPSTTDRTYRIEEFARLASERSGLVLTATDAEGFTLRWTEIQAGFVDHPREAVNQADELVAELMRHLAELFSTHRTDLESTLSTGDASTEDLRLSLKRYRSFFNRLLKT
jgi:carotenoid cleavage dioxygenase-like enzyme